MDVERTHGQRRGAVQKRNGEEKYAAMPSGIAEPSPKVGEPGRATSASTSPRLDVLP